MTNFWKAVSDLRTEENDQIEYRLYYDDAGMPTFYTCDKLSGNYIVVDAETYAAGRYDIRIINGIIQYNKQLAVPKLVLSDIGTKCLKQDITIISDENYCFWKLKTDE